MTTTSPAISNSTDLVLQLAGGDRNGQLIPVNTAKCLLSSLIADKAEAEKYRCAIFRGEKGVAFRSYSELVLVNGNKTSVQWLKEGDTIQLTPEMKVIVKHLGTFLPTKATGAPQAPAAAARQIQSTTAMGAGTSIDSDNTPQPTNASGPVSNGASAGDSQVGQRVNALSDQLTSLVDAASQSGTAPAATGETNEPTLQAPAAKPLSDQKMASASSNIQDYLDKALASTGAGAIASPETQRQTPVTAVATPADSAAATAGARPAEATLEIPATPDASTSAETAAETAAKLRKEEVTNSLNRLLAGTDPNAPLEYERQNQPSSITAEDQSAAATKTDSVVLPDPAQPTTFDASQLIAASSESSTAPPAAATPVATENAATDPAAATTPSSEAPKTQSLEFLKSLGIDADELGLNDKKPAQERPAQENATIAFPLPESPSENAPAAALPTADEIIASASMGSAVETASDPVAAAEVESVEEVAEPAAPKKAESVADVLARMQGAGSLESFSMDGPAEETAHEPIANVSAEVAPAKPEVTETIVIDDPAESEPSGDADNSVEDYMSQLLNRMRGGEDSKESKDEVSDSKESAAPEEAPVETKIAETPKVESPQERLTPEQFVPKQKAQRVKSFDSLREIANNSNRLAIQDHLANQRKVSTQTKMQLALISLGFGVLFFLMSCVFSAKVSVGGVFCGMAFLICGVVFAKFYRDEQQLDASIVKAQKDKG